MRYRLSLVLVLLVLALPTFAQTAAPPVVNAISPDSGPASGGTSVAVIGSGLGLPPNFACVLPCPAKVTFDGTLAELKDERDDVLVVVTPPHAAGAVDVKVTTGDGRSVTVANAFRYVTTAESIYEAILFPIHLDGEVPGANGSRWSSQLFLRNNAPDLVVLAPWPCDAACPPVFPVTRTLQAGETLHGLPPFFRPPSSNPSRVLYVTKEWADRVSAHVRLFNAADSAIDAGTEIPVVRDEDLLTGSVQFHSIPLSTRFRAMLRIYDLARSDSRFRVRVYEQSPGTATAPPIREFELTATNEETGEFKTRAAYASYGDFHTILDLPSIMPPSLRVEVEPLSQGSRFWAFVSITNNATQRVTLVTPQ